MVDAVNAKTTDEVSSVNIELLWECYLPVE